MVGLLNEDYSCKLDKDAFFADIGYEPHEGQKLIHNSDARSRAVACGVRFGKSVWAAMEGLAAAMQPAKRSCGWIVAPTYDLTQKVFREIVFIASEKLPDRIIKLQEGGKLLVLRNASGGESEIRAKSADNPVSLLGEGLDWLVVVVPVSLSREASPHSLWRSGWQVTSTSRDSGAISFVLSTGSRPQVLSCASRNR